MISLSSLSLIALSLHLLGDFQLQPQRLSGKKQESWKAFLLHGLIYAALFALLLLTDLSLWPALAVIAGSHLLIDALKQLLLKTERGRHCERALYYIDQALHLIILLLVCELWRRPAHPLLIDGWNRDLIKWALLVLLLTKPTNVSMKHSLKRYAEAVRPREGDASAVSGAGALIGSMERLLVLILLGLQQYAAIGLVFTAKSLARYEHIIKQQGFAEYYLIGSLASLLTVLSAWLLLFRGLS